MIQVDKIRLKNALRTMMISFPENFAAKLSECKQRHAYCAPPVRLAVSAMALPVAVTKLLFIGFCKFKLKSMIYNVYNATKPF